MELYGSRLVLLVLYGTQARGDAELGSDIDVLVVLEGEVAPFHEIEHVTPITADLSLKHDVVISCVYVSAERYYREKSPFMLNVRREGVALSVNERVNVLSPFPSAASRHTRQA